MAAARARRGGTGHVVNPTEITPMVMKDDARQQILAVDDDVEHATMLAALLHGHAVHGATTAAGALRMARKRPFHLYILDYHLPDEDGLELCRRIKTFDPHTPVLMLSAEDLRARATRVGADAAAVKGGDPALVIETVSVLLRRQAQRNNTARAIEELAIADAAQEQQARRAAEDAELSAKTRELAEDVRRARVALEKIRSVRALAFRQYLAGGGARRGFVEAWPQVVEHVGSRLESPRNRYG
jgi:DNA-binding response OmpR family regulator